ncbi:MAG: DMT family transporter [Candidatus Bathyarchaeia archaeon]
MRQPVRESKESAFVLLIISSVLWGSTFVSVKIGLAYLNAYNFAFLRLAVAALILLPALGLHGEFRAPALKERVVWLLGLLNGIAFSLQFVGLLYTTAAKTALLVDLNVIVVALLSWKVFQESFGPRKKVGVILGVLGAVLITTNGNLSTLANGELVGDLLVFSAGLIWAFFIVLHKRVLLRRDRNVIEMSAVVMLATAFLLAPMAIFFGGLDLVAVPLVGWEWVAYTALIGTVLPYGLWVLALKSVTATIASVVGMLEIVAAMILSSLLLKESYSMITLLGAVLIFVSILAVAES